MNKDRSWTGEPRRADADEAVAARQRGWRRLETDRSWGEARLRRSVSAVVLLLGVAATFTAVLLWFRPPPPARLVLIGAGYEDNLQLPPNASGRLALDRFAQIAVNSSPWSTVLSRPGRVYLNEGVLEFRGGESWASSLARCSEPVAMVFWAVHAGADTEGAFLLPSEAGAEPADRVRLADVLRQFAAMPRQTAKLLLIDASPLDDDWSLGMLQNDFARTVVAMEPQIAAIPNLAVILSSGVDQRCWGMGAGDVSVFSHFVMESLVRGPWERRNAPFNAQHLFEEVRYHVQQWVAQHRHAEQTPLLLPHKDGLRRARAIPLMFRLQPADVPEWADPVPAIAAAWERYACLQREAPHARVRTPHLWRRFEMLLIRHEQLLLGGERAAAEGIRDEALRVEGDIRELQILPLESVAAALPMPALAGEAWNGQAQDPALFEKLWAARPDERPAVWLKHQTGPADDAADPMRLRRQLLAMVVQRAATAPEQNLTRAAELVRLVHDGTLAVVPAEAHFVLMLDRYLPKPVSQQQSALIGRALQVRVLAEQAAMSIQPEDSFCPEYVLPWTRGTIAAADALRRPGEDLLFSTEADDLAEASRLLEQSAVLYHRAIADGATAGFVLRQCDEAAYELMHYSKWASAAPRKVLEEAGALIVAMWTQVHALEHGLRSEPSPAGLPEVKRQADQIADGRTRLRTLMNQSIADAAQPDPENLESVTALLEIPFIPAATRVDLVRRRLQLERRTLDGVAMPARKPDDKSLQDRLSRTRMRGEMALAALGPWTTKLSGGRESQEDTLHAIQTFATQPDWQPALAVAEAAIGDRWRRVTRESKRLARAATECSDPRQVVLLLLDADRLARRSLAVDAPLEGARMLRSWLVAEALQFQASRAAADHWENERPGAAPYYRTAAKTFLRDARILCERASLTTEGITQLAAQIDEEQSLEVQAVSRVALTAGDHARLSIGLAKTSSWLPDGFPLVWAAAAAGVPDQDAVTITPLSPGRRVVLARIGAEDERDGRKDAAEGGPPSVRVEIASPLLARLEASPPASPTPLSAKIQWFVFHRGALVRRETEVVLYPRPDAESSWRAPPPRAGITVAAEESLLKRLAQARGALTIVLDCTGSMGPLGEEPSEEPTRFQSVLAAFRELLRGIPPGATVSVWTFGQAVGDTKTVEQAEDTIARLVEPMVWTGEPAQIRDVAARAERLVPWNESPILRAMLTARQDLIRADGARTMILLTDGIDNRFSRDKELNPAGQSVSDALVQWFRGTGIRLDIIGFQVANHEDEEAHRQFGVVAGLEPPGSFVTVDEVESLMESVRRVSRPALQYRKTWRDTADQGELLASPGVVGVLGKPMQWTAFPAEHRSRAFELQLVAGPAVAGEAAVSPGDALALSLAPRGDGLALERVPLAAQLASPAARTLKEKGWLATVANCALADSGALRLLVAVEPAAGEARQPVRIRHPAEFWMELLPAEGRRPAISWRRAAGYPAAVWTAASPDWPLDADGAPRAACLRVWWLADHRAKPAVALRRDEDFRVVAGIPRRLRVEGDEVVIESVSVEPRHLAARQAGSAPPAPCWCIVVRVSHPPNRALRATLDGLEPFHAEEHRHYLAAGKYVGVFVPAAGNDPLALEQRLADDLRGLQLTSIAAFQQEAETTGHYIEFANLEIPTTPGSFLTPPLPME